MSNTYRIAAAVPAIRPADVHGNAKAHYRLIQQAQRQQVQLLCFPELSLCGATCGDLLQQEALQKACLQQLRSLLHRTKQLPMYIVVGLPMVLHHQLYNAMVIGYQGEIQQLILKQHISAQGDCCEARWFQPAPHALGVDKETDREWVRLTQTHIEAPLEVVVQIGSDASSYPLSSKVKHPTLLLHADAHAQCVGYDAQLRHSLCNLSAHTGAIYLHCNAGTGESSTDGVYSGRMLICQGGKVLAENQGLVEEGLVWADVEQQVKTASPLPPFPRHPLRRNPFLPTDEPALTTRCEEIRAIQAAGLQKRCQHTQAHSCILGISGGLDSTLALLVAVDAADTMAWSRKQVIGVTLPGFGTTNRTYDNAIGLMQALDIDLRCIPIQAACEQHFRDIGHSPEIHDVTYENAQARERTQILLDLANRENGLVVGTGDLSEIALGWCTFNGDHIANYNINSGITKTVVRAMVRHHAQRYGGEIAQRLYDIIDTPVSPELLPKGAQGELLQKTEDKVGPYELHDFFLYYVLRKGYTPQRIVQIAEKVFSRPEKATDTLYDRATIVYWLRNFYRRFFSQQFKRNCSVDGPKVGSVGLSPRGGYIMPSDACGDLWI